MAGRKKDSIWVNFTELPTKSGKGVKASCNTCGKVVMGLVARLKKHVELCSPSETVDAFVESIQSQDSGKRIATPTPDSNGCASASTANKRKLESETNASKRLMSNFVTKTSTSQKQIFDEHIARYIYATNSSFHTVQNKEFKKMISALHPGYNPPNEVEIGNNLLNKIYEEEKQKCSENLKGQIVNLSLDGWSNVHNEPIVCGVITDSAGDTFIVNSVNTSGHPHTTEYLAEVAKATLKKCGEEYKCTVQSIVTDNASNVKSMRAELEKDEGLNLITYGCSAHLLNLLAEDLNIPNVTEHIVYVMKYFRNNHLASAKYKEAGGLKLTLPQEVRWNTVADCLSSYIKHWPILLNVCENNRNDIEPLVYNKITNFGIKRNAEDLLERLKPISVILDQVQKKDCLISNAVHLWKDLKKELINIKLNEECIKAFSARYKQALGPPHFLSYFLDPRYAGENLTNSERTSALLFAKEKYSPLVMPIILKFHAKAEPFNEFLFDSSIVTELSPLDWWKTRIAVIEKDDVRKKVLFMIDQLFSAIASSASIERMFSTFGLVQSKIRNRLGNDKAAKLVFLYQHFNKS